MLSAPQDLQIHSRCEYTHTYISEAEEHFALQVSIHSLPAHMQVSAAL